MPRETDHAFDALVEATNSDVYANRGELNKALHLIKGQTQKQGVELGLEIRARARAYRLVMGEALLTPTALAKHWTRVQAEADRTQATNQSAAVTHCRICGGDRFVTYSLRPVIATMWQRERNLEPSGYYEEMAPCPTCNLAAYETGARTLDPAQVRERIGA